MRLLERMALVALCTSVVCFVPQREGAAQVLSSFAAIDSLSASELVGAQVRFTFVGDTMKPFPTLAFTTTGATLDLTGFIPFYRRGFSYVGDGAARAQFSVSPAEMEAMIDSVGTVADVVLGGADSLGYLSFGILAFVTGEPRCFEAIVGSRVGAKLFTAVLAALRNNAPAVDAISSTACALGMLDVEAPQIVDAQVRIDLRGFRRERKTALYVGKVRVTNTSTESVPSPLAVALEFVGGVRLSAPDGHTCAVQPGGIPFVRLRDTGALAPGQSIETVIRVENPGGERLRLQHARAFVVPSAP
jgi:hypothetical protein